MEKQEEYDQWLAQMSEPLPGEEMEQPSEADWSDDNSGFMEAMTTLGRRG